MNSVFRTGQVGVVLATAVALILWAISAVGRAEVLETAYSFKNAQGGGLAVVAVDAQSGKISPQRVLFESTNCTAPNKVRRADQLRMLVVTNERDKGPHVFLVPAGGGDAAQSVQLPDEPDELRVAGQYALATCADDSLVLVDLRTAKVATTWQADRELTPPGKSPEDICILPDLRHAVVSLQKDGKAGKKLGSRLVVLTVPDLQRLADIQLERNHPELHIEGNGQQQGPSPEVVLVSEPTNTLLATLDLYGAVVVMDWSEAKAGRMSNWQYLSTSLDGSWGSAFPDRASLVQEGTHALVFNAGPQGGGVLVDMAGRKVVHCWNVPPGLEKPVCLAQLGFAYSVCSGKVKSRGDSDVEQRSAPGRAVYAFDFRPPGQQQPDRLEVLPFDLFVTRVAALDSTNRPLLLLAAGTMGDAADTLIVYDPAGRRVLDRQPAVGTIGQFEGQVGP